MHCRVKSEHESMVHANGSIFPFARGTACVINAGMKVRVLPVLILASALLPVFAAFGQYEVSLQLDKLTYVLQEPMTATVTVVNRSGADVVVGGAKGRPWMMFNVTDSTDRSLSPAQMTSDDPVVFPAGERITKRLKLTDTHSFSHEGTYAATVSVFHPASGEFYKSNRARFIITDEKVFGRSLIFGVPQGQPGAGQMRRYTLMVHQDQDRSYMYFRLVDDRTEEKLLTYQLGPLTLAREPQYTLDRANQLHVLFMATPEVSIYYVIGPDGQPKSQEYYKDGEGTRPQLFLTAQNVVMTSGGRKVDPRQEQAEAAAAASRIRSVSERPPGL